jgi:hypothetical protein
MGRTGGDGLQCQVTARDQQWQSTETRFGGFGCGGDWAPVRGGMGLLGGEELDCGGGFG